MPLHLLATATVPTAAYLFREGAVDATDAAAAFHEQHVALAEQALRTRAIQNRA